MQRIVSGILLAVALALPVLTQQPARAIGVYEDAVGHAGFLFGRHQSSVRAAFVRTDDDAADASIFVVSVTHPLRPNLLIQVEQPFISLIGPSGIESGFGDLHARARLRLAGGDGRVLHALGGLRVGTGTRLLYPYSSQSFDMELVVGYVDSLDILHVWGAIEGGVVKREPSGLDESDRHENFARANGGIAFPFGSALHLRLGVSGLLFRSGGAREVYFSQLQYRYSPSLEVRLSTHAEAGNPDERISDFALTAAIHAFF